MNLTARDISQQLAMRADSFARWLLPNGHLESGNWCVGSIDGEAGGSTRIQITGPNAGVWADFAGTDKGDLLNLIVAVRKVTLGEAIKLAKDWLGIREPESLVPKKTYSKPRTSQGANPATESPVHEYLTEERKLDGLTLLQFKIGEMVSQKHGPSVIFPSYSPTGELVNLKYLALKRTDEGKKIIQQERGCAPSLFGWQAIEGEPREVVITEGEIDAMTWTVMGFPALSVPDGAEGESWIDYEWDNLQQFDRIFLNWDNDAPGQKAVVRIAKRLGLHRTLIVKLEGYKDANEALQAGATDSLFHAAICSAKPVEPEQVKSPNAFRDKVQERFWPTALTQPGFQSGLFLGQMRFRPGELTVWTGIAGHGKSALLSQLMLESTFRGHKSAIASMEMPGDQTLYRMLCQSCQNTRPNPDNIDEMLEWLSGKLWLFDLMGNVSPALLLDLMEYCFSRYGVDEFVIDSLMKCSVDSDDYNAQRMLLNDLCAFGKETQTHIHLVAHARKGRDEYSAPGKLDVKGSSDIINQPDNVMVVWRNKEKAPNSNNGSESKEADNVVYCNKQRETGLEFSTKLRHHSGVFSFSLLGEQHPDLNILTILHPPETEPVGGSMPPEPELPYEQNETEPTEPVAN